VKLVETTAGQVTDINPAGPQASREALDALAMRLDALAPEIVVLAGSLPPGLPVEAWAILLRPWPPMAASCCWIAAAPPSKPPWPPARRW
jgi:fructose-1-phosphate kinase PfkB-like protein